MSTEKQLSVIAAELQRLNRNLEKLITKQTVTSKTIKEMNSALEIIAIGSEGEPKQSDK